MNEHIQPPAFGPSERVIYLFRSGKTVIDGHYDACIKVAPTTIQEIELSSDSDSSGATQQEWMKVKQQKPRVRHIYNCLTERSYL